MSKLNAGTVALREYLERPGSKDILQLAVDAGVSMTTIYRWKAGGRPVSRALRNALEAVTSGAVAASSWDQ